MTSLVKAIQERLAKICDALQEKFEHRDYDLSEGARQCAYAIRAADLEEFERELAALTARLEAKGAECEALRRDAERYRWLRKGGDYYLHCINPDAGHIQDAMLDDIIDAAKGSHE